MEGEWITGQELIGHLKIPGAKLFDYLKRGLQAYNSTLKKVIDKSSFSEGSKIPSKVFVEMVSAHSDEVGHVL